MPPSRVPGAPAVPPTGPRPPLVALLLVGSGFCALVYEVAWLRMLRLVFGVSTAASAAVLAIFLGGLGLGGLLLGRRADRTPSPLRLYADLETGAAVAAAATPLLVAVVARLYFLLGGTAVLGLAGATVLRLALALVVLGLPAVLMGGTLPAAVRAVERSADAGRRGAGLLYGANTLGAVGGSLYATFLALELLGTNLTVWSASLLNLVVALAARLLAARAGAPAAAPPESPEPAPTGAAPVALVLVAAAVVGFAFLLMELVWYRMLAPLLGGSTYTFGLILAVALAGIGAGGLVYAAGARARRPTLVGFVTTCVVEALCIALPYALGDRVALLAMQLRPLGFLGFGYLVLVWLPVTMLVVLPAAVVAGYQFPLLVGLLGAGERGVGREVGLAYAANTAGAIVGSLAGGFGLIPMLTAPGAWRAVVLVLVALGAACLLPALRGGAALRGGLVPLGLGLASALLCLADGPTAFWRHSAIGAGRLEASFTAPNDLRRLLDERRRRIVWEADGIESAVALDAWNAYGFLINGKNDGNTIGDAPTQVMLGLIGPLHLRHPGGGRPGGGELGSPAREPAPHRAATGRARRPDAPRHPRGDRAVPERPRTLVGGGGGRGAVLRLHRRRPARRRAARRRARARQHRRPHGDRVRVRAQCRADGPLRPGGSLCARRRARERPAPACGRDRRLEPGRRAAHRARARRGARHERARQGPCAPAAPARPRRVRARGPARGAGALARPGRRAAGPDGRHHAGREPVGHRGPARPPLHRAGTPPPAARGRCAPGALEGERGGGGGGGRAPTGRLPRLPYLPMVLPPAPRPQPRPGLGADRAASRPRRRPLRDARRAFRGADARRAAGVDLLQHRAHDRLPRPLPRGLRRARAPGAVGAARPRAARALLHAEPRPARGPRPRRPRRLRRRHPGHHRRRARGRGALTAARAPYSPSPGAQRYMKRGPLAASTPRSTGSTFTCAGAPRAAE